MNAEELEKMLLEQDHQLLKRLCFQNMIPYYRRFALYSRQLAFCRICSAMDL